MGKINKIKLQSITEFKQITFGSGNPSAVNCLLTDYYSKVSLQMCSVPVPSPRDTLQANRTLIRACKDFMFS